MNILYGTLHKPSPKLKNWIFSHTSPDHLTQKMRFLVTSWIIENQYFFWEMIEKYFLDLSGDLIRRISFREG